MAVVGGSDGGVSVVGGKKRALSISAHISKRWLEGGRSWAACTRVQF